MLAHDEVIGDSYIVTLCFAVSLATAATSNPATSFQSFFASSSKLIKNGSSDDAVLETVFYAALVVVGGEPAGCATTFVQFWCTIDRRGFSFVFQYACICDS